MTAHRKTAGDIRDAEWLRSTWEWCQELEKEHGLLVQLSLYPTLRRGVWRTQVRALEMVDGRPAGIRAQVAGEYPNVNNQNLGAHLFRQLIELEARIEEDALRRNT